jgi:hypothetical protein
VSSAAAGSVSTNHALEQHLDDRPRRNCDEDPEQAVQGAEGQHRENADEGAHANRSMHDPRGMSTLFSVTWTTTENPITRSTVFKPSGRATMKAGPEARVGPIKHGLEQAREKSECQDVWQADQRVADRRGRADGQHRQPLSTQIGAQLGLDLVPDIEHAGSPPDRKKGECQSFKARHFHRPVEGDGEDGHEVREELDDARRDSDDAAGELGYESVRRAFECREPVPNQLERTGRTRLQAQAKGRIGFRQSGRGGADLLDQCRPDEERDRNEPNREQELNQAAPRVPSGRPSDKASRARAGAPRRPQCR